MKIHSLFPTPVYETNLNREFTKQELELIKASEIECIPNMGNTSSEDNYILEQEGFKDLKGGRRGPPLEVAQDGFKDSKCGNCKCAPREYPGEL